MKSYLMTTVPWLSSGNKFNLRCNKSITIHDAITSFSLRQVKKIINDSTNQFNKHSKASIKKGFYKTRSIILKSSRNFWCRIDFFFKSTRHKIGNTWPKQNTGETSTLKLNNIGGRM